ncbi:MAG: NUDIX hydrolase [Desulfococcaceae bacterium]|jgi:mutator protein MutT|nr:NUDIX hydrolase [Desulfococcaceae bacterium]
MRPKAYCHFCAHPLREKYVEGRMRLFCDRCSEPLYENPIPAACVILTNPQNQVLLVKRSVEPKKNLWCLPGGFMELGETPQQSAVRELREETGLRGRIERLLGTDSHSSAFYGTVTLICFLVREYEGEPGPGDDACDLAFFAPDNLPEIAFAVHQKFIRDYYQSMVR